MIHDDVLWTIEVGIRAALHTETRARDLRWFRGLFR
jgi:hypothetical protein